MCLIPLWDSEELKTLKMQQGTYVVFEKGHWKVDLGEFEHVGGVTCFNPCQFSWNHPKVRWGWWNASSFNKHRQKCLSVQWVGSLQRKQNRRQSFSSLTFNILLCSSSLERQTLLHGTTAEQLVAWINTTLYMVMFQNGSCMNYMPGNRLPPATQGYGWEIKSMAVLPSCGRGGYFTMISSIPDGYCRESLIHAQGRNIRWLKDSVPSYLSRRIV